MIVVSDTDGPFSARYDFGKAIFDHSQHMVNSPSTQSPVFDNFIQNTKYSSEQIHQWRKEFGLEYLRHSLGSSGYTDEDLLKWRSAFDKYTGGKEVIDPTNFQKWIKEKMPEAQNSATTISQIWSRFDHDGNEAIDFGEFCKTSFSFDLERLQEHLVFSNVEDIFPRYRDEDVITEEGIRLLMKDFHFTVVTQNECRRLLAEFDKDQDGLISVEDLDSYLRSLHAEPRNGA